jgi:hypothetical protein
MKRRSFIKGLLGITALMGVTAKAATVIDPKKQEETEFYAFFHKFNGFPINDNQKVMYQGYVNDWKMLTCGRQVGATVLLVTLAAWRTLKGDVVLYAAHNEDMNKYCSQLYHRNMTNNLGFPQSKYTTSPVFSTHMDKLRGRSYDVLLEDNPNYMSTTAYNNLKEIKFVMKYRKNPKYLAIDTI